MNDMPKVSIIMGVYNCKDKAQLIKSVDSIINQRLQIGNSLFVTTVHRTKRWMN